MFGNQWLERDVGQNITAVNNEKFLAKKTFDIFDAAARFKQVRLVNKRDGKASIFPRGEEILEQFWLPVRVDYESVHSHADQMIERESNERLLKDWDKRLRQLVSQRT